MAYSINTRKTWEETLSDLHECFRKWGVEDWNAWRIGGGAPVALRWQPPGGNEVRLTMRNHAWAEDNIRVLFLAADAMRLNEARGIGAVMAEAYLQLAAPSAQTDPYQLLGVRPDAAMQDIEDMFRIKARRAHPDVEGGNNEAMKELNDAMERIKQERL